MLDQLGLRHPIIQAPMAGVATPALAAAVCEAGALGSLGLGGSSAGRAGAMIADLRGRTGRPFHVNVFVHDAPVRDERREAEWLAALAPTFRRYGAAPPAILRTLYSSFAKDDAMLRVLIGRRPQVVSFHFGLPAAERIQALRSAGCILLASVTNLAEAQAAKAAGIDAVIAQGFEAGGHRGVFDPELPDERLPTAVLTRLLVAKSGLPVIAAGGIMDGKGIRAALDLGAVAAQLGTAFIACPESSADDAYRAALLGPQSGHTVMTPALSGRPARCLANKFTALAGQIGIAPPAYPTAYDAGKALNAAAKAGGESGFAAQWAGQGAPLARALPAARLIEELAREMGA
jgi:nitronate monooxygenase